MSWYKRLRWRLIGPQFLVVLVGVGMMLLAMQAILQAAPELVRSYLAELVHNPSFLSQTEADLLVIFRNTVLLSVLIAAVAALVAGVLSSIILWRTIIAPLHLVAHSTRRIADGRFNERVTIPDNSGEAMAQLVISFNQMAEALAEVEAQRITLLGNISHELRTPLTGLKGYMEGLTDGLFAANEETFAWMSQEIERLRRLVDDIQHLSRIEAGQFNLLCEEFEVTAVAERIIMQLQPQAQAQELTLSLMNTPPVFAYADKDRVAQIMLNLVGNALRYTPISGSIVMTVQPHNHHVAVAIQDSGIGIPSHALPYVFERFYRVDQSRARTSGGSGIGLTIVRHLVWAMGGEITAVSPGLNQGSIFTFTLPTGPT